jgi:hypothetical protein
MSVLVACSDRSDSSASDEKGSCIVPTNPWTGGEGGGHEAGFNWAQENHYACPSNYGESFEEGCVEYYNQLNRYDACKAAKRR